MRCTRWAATKSRSATRHRRGHDGRGGRAVRRLLPHARRNRAVERADAQTKCAGAGDAAARGSGLGTIADGSSSAAVCLPAERAARFGAPRISARPRPWPSVASLDANGQKGPAERALKRTSHAPHRVWQAKSGWAFPSSFRPASVQPVAAPAACAWPAIARPDAVHRIFRFVWRDGRLPDLPIEWAELVAGLGVHDAECAYRDRRK